jgi:beta-galactosidase
MAQTAEVFRSEFVPFDTRDDAATLKRGSISHYETFSPKVILRQADTVTVGQVVDVPLLMTDRDIYLHLENVGQAYTLLVNNQRVASVEDDRTPREFLISPYIKEGQNAVMLDLRPSRTPQLQADKPTARATYDNSYLIFQHKLHVDDYRLTLAPDSTRKYGLLKLDIVVKNSYKGEEPITAGYDIYDPKGKLLDYGSKEVLVAGNSRDTVHIERLIYQVDANRWGTRQQPLYKVTLYTKRNSMLWEYIPLRVGFNEVTYADGQFYHFGTPLKLSSRAYNAAKDETTTQQELKKLKLQGINLLLPDYPQPYWYYALADRLGFFVIDCAAIYAPEAVANRAVGGTPSNDPSLCDEFIGRVKAMYARSRNHTSIIGFSLGRNSGNGYNMYKAYQWLRQTEPTLPIFYVGADGEWNTDDPEGRVLKP